MCHDAILEEGHSARHERQLGKQHQHIGAGAKQKASTDSWCTERRCKLFVWLAMLAASRANWLAMLAAAWS